MVVALALAIVAILVAEYVKRPPPSHSSAIDARLELSAGEVWVDEGEGEKSGRSDTALRTGAKVRTAAGARALLRLPDGASLFMRESTALELGADRVTLVSGEAWLDAPAIERKPLRHVLGDVEVTAIDAGLSLKKSDEGAEIYLARGMALVVSPAGRAEVKAGELASVKSGAAPQVAALSFWEDWTGGMADHGVMALGGAEGNGVIFAVDAAAAPGSPAQKLQVKRQSVRAVIRGGLVETEVDQEFFNPGSNPVEGWYWFNVPAGASVTGFAVETDGVLVEGEFIERREAAERYQEAKETGHAPAILEWVDSKSYRARIFPIAPSGTRRVVLRYLELRPTSHGKLSYVYPMAGRAPTRIGELSLSVDLGDDGTKMRIATLGEARIEEGGRRVTMRRSGYTPRIDFQLEAELPTARPALIVTRFGVGEDFNIGEETADYIMARYTPKVDWEAVGRRAADVVVVVDTSAAGDEASRRLRLTVAESILRSLSADDRFAVLALDVAPRVIHPRAGLAQATPEERAKALEALASHADGGASDLSAMFDAALSRLHDSEHPALVYVGDGVATSGAMTGEQLVERLRRALSTSRARLYTMAVGPEADQALLGELARAGAGSSLRVEDAQEAAAQALELVSELKVPALTDFEIDLGAALDEPLSNVSGKVSRGTEVVLLARTHHDLPAKVNVRGRLLDKVIDEEVDVVNDPSVVRAFVPRLWAAEYVRRLLGGSAGAEAEQGRIVELGLDYAIMTPFTSVLALENESAYARMGIKRRTSPLRGVRLSALTPAIERELTMPGAEAPRSMMGCDVLLLRSKSDEEPAEAPQIDRPADNKEGGTGVRAKGDDGSMGSPTPTPPTDLEPNRYGTPGPGGDPHAPPLKARRTTGDRAHWSGGQPGAGKREATEETVNIPVIARQAPAMDPWSLRHTCSALARLGLAQRVAVWRKRLATARGPEELLARYQSAAGACELDDWHAERVFLDFLQARIDSEGSAKVVLEAFASRPDVQRHLAKLILRRAVDDRLALAVERVVFGSAVDWAAVDRKLSEIDDPRKRLAELRAALAKAPDDPNGTIRLVSLLAATGEREEALRLGRRLREQGLLTLRVARQLGDLLARAKLDQEALRTYSEIVEFDAANPASRQLLGDIFLSRGWYDAAYRQYKTGVELLPDDPSSWLRLANAAAGAGRIDEALRLDRRVANAQGRPGPNDPRRWARLLSAARLADLLAKPPKGTSEQAIQRELKELALFSSAGSLLLLTWEDLTSDVTLVLEQAGAPAKPTGGAAAKPAAPKELALGEVTDAASVGLQAIMVTEGDAEGSKPVARLRSLPRQEALTLRFRRLSWDGKSFAVRLAPSAMAAEATRQEL
jgi:tetratricopeptide (TPR) repeat protein